MKAATGKKTTAKKSGKEKSCVLIDGLPISTMSREQLEGHVIRLRNELDKEREERNYFQLERDKLQAFWEVSRQQLRAKQAEAQDSERKIDENEERHLKEKKLLNQKMRHMLFDNQNKLSVAKRNNLTQLKAEQTEQEQQQQQLTQEIEILQTKLNEQHMNAQEVIQKLRLSHSSELAKMKLQWETQVSEVESKYQERMKGAEKELRSRYEAEVQELEERKNYQLDNLIKNHDKALLNMKNFYNDITINNMALITTMKEQLTQKTETGKKLEKQMEQLSAENKQLSKKLHQAEEQVREWEKQIKICNKDRQLLTNAKKQLASSKEEIQSLKWELEIVKQAFMKLEKERDELHEKFVCAIQDVQQRTSLKNLLLESKWKQLEKMMDNKLQADDSDGTNIQDFSLPKDSSAQEST